MALDFPNSPVAGSVFTSGPGGPAWQWDGVKWESIGVPGATGAAGPVSRNLLHNPYFNIQQRGTGTWTGSSNPYTADRWMLTSTNDTNTASIISLADSDRAAIGDEAAVSALQIVFAGSATSGSYTAFLQRLESTRRFSNKQVVWSFWARATSGVPRLGVSYTQRFGTGGSPSADVLANMGMTPALSATWQRYSITATLSSASGKTFGTTAGTDYTQFIFWLSDVNAGQSGGIGQQSGTVQFWGMQLEIGSQATPLEKIDPRFDLANCVRFYQQVRATMRFSASGGSQTFAHTIAFSPMRASPTSTDGGSQSGTNNISGQSFSSYNPQSGLFSATSNAAGDTYDFNHLYSLSADL